MNLLKAWDRKFVTDGTGSKISANPNEVAKSIVSICWRASISDSPMYAGVSVNQKLQSVMFLAIRSESNNVLRTFSVKISRLWDKRNRGSTGFPPEQMSGLIIPVQTYLGTKKGRSNPSHAVFHFAACGFLIHLFVPKLPTIICQKPGMLQKGQNELFAPIQHIFDYPPIAEALALGYGKHHKGETTVKR